MASSGDSGINGVAGGTGSHEEELVFFFQHEIQNRTEWCTWLTGTTV